MSGEVGMCCGFIVMGEFVFSCVFWVCMLLLALFECVVVWGVVRFFCGLFVLVCGILCSKPWYYKLGVKTFK